MGRCASGSERVYARVFVVAAALAVFALGACRAFVDLDGLGDGPGTSDGADAADVTPPLPEVDAADGGSDAEVDANKPDVIFITDAGDADAPPPCPNGGGPTPVRVSAQAPSGAVSFCIDSSEVTNAQYETYLATNPDPAAQGALCQWNTSLMPKAGWPYAAGDAERPVHSVNWCDATAFCKWAGKRLCGKINGGALTPATANQVLQSEMVFACSSGGARVYPYGDVYDPVKCNGGETADPDVLDIAKARTTCEALPGVFDLAGNVHEWIDLCVIGADPATDACYGNGGSLYHGAGDMRCDFVETVARNAVYNEYGFRCCSD